MRKKAAILLSSLLVVGGCGGYFAPSQYTENLIRGVARIDDAILEIAFQLRSTNERIRRLENQILRLRRHR